LKEYLEYADSRLDYYDNCCTDTFSLLWIEDFFRQGLNEVTERTSIYWSSPRTDIRYGLCCIENDSHILAICEAVKEEKVLHLLVDHTNFIKRLRQDVVMQIPSKYLGGSAGDLDNAEDVGIVNGSDIEDAEDAENAKDG
jgi:hypothetical protein